MAANEVSGYSVVFKKRVVAEYESGASASSLMRKYGIGGKQTISRWVERYSEKGFRQKMSEGDDVERQAEMAALKARIANLERIVAQLSLDKLMLESSLKVAETELGYEVKKSKQPKSSPKRSKGGQRGG